MREHAFIFTAESIRAMLAGRKTQTRRVITRRNSEATVHFDALDLGAAWTDRGFPRENGHYTDGYLHAPITEAARREAGYPEGDRPVYRLRPRIMSGDVIWARETWAWRPPGDGRFHAIYKADHDERPEGLDCWRSPACMPRIACRLTRRVVSVRAERVQDISDGDCYAEGLHDVIPSDDPTADAAERRWFAAHWDAINAKRGHPWESNDCVWVYEMEEM